MTKTLSETAQARLLERVNRIPIVKTLGISLVRVDEGEIEAKMPRKGMYDGIYESLHGGILMTLADSVAAFAILTLTNAEEMMATTDMNIRFLAPCLTEVTAKARIIKLGRSLCPVAVDLYDAEGTHVAVAQVSYLRLS